MIKEKSNTIFKLLARVVLVMVLGLAFVQPAFAAEVGEGVIEGTETNPAEAAITKVLEMPIGTDTPNAFFEFLITPVEVDESKALADLNNMPQIGTDFVQGTAPAPNSSKLTIDLTNGTQEDISAGIKQISKESYSLFAGVNWTHTGVYTYRITEIAGTYPASTSDPIEEMTYSLGEYEVSVYVSQGDNGFYVRYIGALVITPGAPGQEAGVKVDPTPGGDPDVDGDYSKMIFTNNYLKTNSPETPDPEGNAVVAISKTVEEGDFADTELYFDFDVTVWSPETIADTNRTYKAFVLQAGTIVSPIPATQAPAGTIKTDPALGKQYIEFTHDTLTRIQLKHDQVLAFTNTPVGTKFDVKEIDPKNYLASYELTLNNVRVEGGSATTAGDSLGLSAPHYIGELKNSADFTNMYRDVTPAGIAVDNLPYIVMIGVALLGLAGFVVFKMRKRTQSDA